MSRGLAWACALTLNTALSFGWSGQVLAQQGYRHGNAGLGIGFGSVDGISGYYKYGQHQFFQGLLAFQLDDAFFLSGDLCNAYDRALPEAPAVVPYFCFGGFYSHIEDWRRDDRYFDDDIYDDVRRGEDVSVLGVRIPLGVQIFLPKMPIQLVVEIVPGLTLTPGTDFYIQHMLGVRYLF